MQCLFLLSVAAGTLVGTAELVRQSGFGTADGDLQRRGGEECALQLHSFLAGQDVCFGLVDGQVHSLRRHIAGAVHADNQCVSVRQP